MWAVMVKDRRTYDRPGPSWRGEYKAWLARYRNRNQRADRRVTRSSARSARGVSQNIRRDRHTWPGGWDKRTADYRGLDHPRCLAASPGTGQSSSWTAGPVEGARDGCFRSDGI